MTGSLPLSPRDSCPGCASISICIDVARLHMRRIVPISLAIAGAAVLAACSGGSARPSHAVLDRTTRVEHPAKTITTRVPGANGCPMFPASNIWNTDISRLPIDSHSAAWLRSMDSANLNLHPDFGPSGGYPYGIPYTIVTNSHRRVRVTFHFPDSDHGLYPFGPDTQIEGGKNAGGDRHALMVNRSTCTCTSCGRRATPAIRTPARARSGTCTPTSCAPRARRRPTPPGCRSCPACLTTPRSPTRPGPASRSRTRSG